MRRSLLLSLSSAAVLATAALATPVRAQVPAPLKVGDEAPDFSLPGATRYGVLEEPVNLRDYQGKTVVLAFFFKARTKG